MGRQVHDEELWPYVRTLLPVDIEESARACGALIRRRGIADAESLLRTLLAYGVTDLSLKSVAAWAKAERLSSLSTPALFYRVRDADAWLSHVLAQVLSSDVAPPRKGLRLRVVDASVITGPAPKGTDWRIHLVAEPGSGCFSGVELTDRFVGEHFALHALAPGDVVLGDRGYSYASHIAAANEAGAAVVVRLNLQTIRLCTMAQQPLNLRARVKEVPKTGIKVFNAMLPIPPAKKTKSHKSWSLSKASAWIPVRVMAARTRSGSIIWVLTTLTPEMGTPKEVMDLYRLRWQVELVFKRLKSLLHLDELPTRQGPTARSWILARLLAAALAQKLVAPSDALSPWGYVLR
jgi:Transposase DDE domain